MTTRTLSNRVARLEAARLGDDKTSSEPAFDPESDPLIQEWRKLRKRELLEMGCDPERIEQMLPKTQRVPKSRSRRVFSPEAEARIQEMIESRKAGQGASRSGAGSA